MPEPTGKCAICDTPTNTSFAIGLRIYYFCGQHKDELFARVTGKAPKKKPKP
jgi:hypothetical protein